jgi:hypothetical protein
VIIKERDVRSREKRTEKSKCPVTGGQTQCFLLQAALLEHLRLPTSHNELCVPLA